jgi:hypothetical protein
MSIVTVRLTVPSESLEFGQILHNGEDVRIELTQFVPTGNTLVPYFWAETADPSSLEEAIRADNRVRSLDRLDEGSNKTLYRVQWATDLDGFLEALEKHDLVVEQAIGTTEEWRFRLRGPDRNNISAFQDTLREKGITSTLKGIWNPHGPNGDPYGLTEKQREAVELAFSEGYFSVPAETNLSEVAEIVGISRQSFSRRLNRGLNRVLAETVIAES